MKTSPLLNLLIATTLLAEEPDHVAFRLRERTEKALAEPLWTYVTNVEQRFPAKLQVFARDWKTPEEVRDAIKGLHREKGLSGVILVGAMPVHCFFIH